MVGTVRTYSYTWKMISFSWKLYSASCKILIVLSRYLIGYLLINGRSVVLNTINLLIIIITNIIFQSGHSHSHLCKRLYFFVTTKTPDIIMVWITSTVQYLNTHYSKIHLYNNIKANTKPQLKKTKNRRSFSNVDKNNINRKLA